MDIRSFVIPASNKMLADSQIEKLNKRAAKLGLPEITLSYDKAISQQRNINGIKRNILFLPVNLSGPLSVSYDGWDFIATLQHLPTGENIIRSISDQFDIPNKYKECGSNCEHCKVNRYRKDTYLVRHNNNQVMQVGSSCIKDFLGGNSPDDILKRANLIAELMQFMNGAQQNLDSNFEDMFHINNFLAQTSAVIRDHGWLSKGEAFNTGAKSTAVRVLDNFNPPYNDFYFKLSEVTDISLQHAKEAIEWVESLSDEVCELSDYLHNIRAIARAGMVEIRTAGFAASMLSAYDRDKAKHQVKPISCHVGIVKVREEFNLTLKNHFTGISQYGEYHRYIFNDDSGNIMIWKASSPADLEDGKRYKIRGTVKEHSEYKNVKQTIITRCEVVTYYA